MAARSCIGQHFDRNKARLQYLDLLCCIACILKGRPALHLCNLTGSEGPDASLLPPAGHLCWSEEEPCLVCM